MSVHAPDLFAVGVDDAREMRDKASALAFYAKQRDDDETRAAFEEIYLRACVRIGEISRELEVSDQAKGGRHPTSGKPTKTDQLTAAGISTSSAQRYEELADDAGEKGERLDDELERRTACPDTSRIWLT